mmetsp:Transcript_9836/g.14870  ORF Transcript_9836/g.14870 Transcript_9836/m.14870 type:complete len:232 (+) Transcript_9836:459-1154(+)
MSSSAAAADVLVLLRMMAPIVLASGICFTIAFPLPLPLLLLLLLLPSILVPPPQQQIQLPLLPHGSLAQPRQRRVKPSPIRTYVKMPPVASSHQFRGIGRQSAHVAMTLVIVKTLEPRYRMTQSHDEFSFGEVPVVYVYVIGPIEGSGTLDSESDGFGMTGLVVSNVKGVIPSHEVGDVEGIAFHAQFGLVEVGFVRSIQVILEEGGARFRKGDYGEVEEEGYVGDDRSVG